MVGPGSLEVGRTVGLPAAFSPHGASHEDPPPPPPRHCMNPAGSVREAGQNGQCDGNEDGDDARMVIIIMMMSMLMMVMALVIVMATKVAWS